MEKVSEVAELFLQLQPQQQQPLNSIHDDEIVQIPIVPYENDAPVGQITVQEELDHGPKVVRK